MEKTKFKIGDEVFFMEYSGPKKEIIKGIEFTVGFDQKTEKEFTVEKPKITYVFSKYSEKCESECFGSKQDLIDSVFSNI